MNRTITLNELVGLLADRLPDKDRAVIESFVVSFFSITADGLKKDQKVKIKGFGTFMLTDDEPPLVTFIPENEIADSVNRPFSFFEAEELDDNVTEAMLEVDPDPGHSDNVEQVVESDSEHKEEEQVNMPVPETDNNAAEAVVEVNDRDTDTEQSPECEHDNEPEKADEPETEESEPKSAPIEPIVVNEEPIVIYRERKWLWIFIGFIVGAIAGYAISHYISNNNNVINVTNVTDDNESAVVIVADTDSADTQSDEPSAVEEDQNIITHEIVTDTVRADRFLTTMARQYYGAMEFWAYIYIENSDKLGDPDRIAPNTVVIIPPAEKYGINRSDEKSLTDAKQKGIEIYSKYKK